MSISFIQKGYSLCFPCFSLNMSNKQTYSICCCFRRRFKLRAAEAPTDIKRLFDSYSSRNEIMGVDQFLNFLKENQGEKNAIKEHAQSIIDGLNVSDRKGLNLQEFFKYLFGDLNPPLSPNRGVHHDMDAPLSHYFIYTGHNSYLTGNQLSSDCSADPIIKALRKGVRVIELDMWPNSTRDDVDIFHGRTLTTPVDLITCLKSIKDHAFYASDYPVIITLEDHLNADLQDKVAKMVHATFREMLFYPGSEHFKIFPSPESLKGKIIISTKPPKEYEKSKVSLEKDSSSGKGNRSIEEKEWGKEVPSLRSSGSKTDNKVDHDAGEEEENDDEHSLHQNVAPQYKRLIAIHAGKHKGHLRDAFRVDHDKVRRLSMSEQELEKAIIKHGTQIAGFTEKNLLRVYPKGTRFDSSNYNPLIGWTRGAQMVAFNMQGYGRPLWLMHGMFRANGGCGYVKKPDFLLKISPNKQIFDPNVASQLKKTLRVKIYMGDGWNKDFHRTHFDFCSPPDFYTKIGIAGVPADSTMMKTRVIDNNWTPVWNQKFEFPLTVPELALLRIEVHESDIPDKDDFAGQTCLPISELQTGIRAVPLFNRKGEKYKFVKLLMLFDYTFP